MSVEPAPSAKAHGPSKKFTYFLDSVFAFTDLPVRLLALCGIVGLFSALDMASPSAILRLLDQLDHARLCCDYCYYHVFWIAEHIGTRNCRRVRLACQ